jgi:uncharacterized iron-regulated protein
MTTSLRHHLLRLQKQTFLRLQQEILDQRRYEERAMRTYRNTYLEEVSSYKKISSKNILLSQCLESSIIYCGDFHTLSRAQYTAVKIIRFLCENNKKVKLGLEMIPNSMQHWANDYVQGRINEEDFLDCMVYEKTWGFPWENYRPLFECAKQYQLSILGLNTSDAGYQTFAYRDKAAAKIMVKSLKKDPHTPIFCLYGDLHLASKHIPRYVAQQFKKKKMQAPPTTTVFQNSDAIYWQLADHHTSVEADVVEVNDSQFCVLSSTPWIKWQSYQSWVEEHITLLDEMDEGQQWDLHYAPDYFHTVYEYAQQIAQFLNVQAKDLDDFRVFSSMDVDHAQNIESIIAQAMKRVDSSAPNMLQVEMVHNRCLFLPHQRTIYLQDGSPNRMAEKASQWVAYCLTNHFCIYHASFTPKERFYRLVLIEMIGFFGSKIINPKRKTNHLRDWQRCLQEWYRKRLSPTQKLHKKVAQKILQHQSHVRAYLHDEMDAGSLRGVYHQDHEPFFLTAQGIGRLMGDYLYTLVQDERVAQLDIAELFASLSREDQAQDTFWLLAQMLNKKRMSSQKSKDELF